VGPDPLNVLLKTVGYGELTFPNLVEFAAG
jgi:hypothetical protein